MKIIQGFFEKEIKDIAQDCEEKSVKQSIAYLRRANFNNPNKFVCRIIDNCCFFAGSICKKHFRLLEIAVRQDFKRKGYGTIMIMQIKGICVQNSLDKITLRVSKENEIAIKFYKRFGAVITGEKDNDWEMEIKV